MNSFGSSVRCATGLGLLVLTCFSPPALAQREKPVLYKNKTPAELYRIVHRARWDVDVDTVLACTSRRTGLTEEEAYKQLMAGRSALPQRLSMLEETIEKGVATILCRGERRDRETGETIISKGIVTLIKEDGTWRIRHEVWKDLPQAEEGSPLEKPTPAEDG